MQFKIFSIPTYSNDQLTEELNKFLRSHQIADVEKQLIMSGTNAYWTFCVHYLPGATGSNKRNAERTDYREVLDEAKFKIFSTLRNCRKQLAEENGVPVYAVFTNEELANIARLPEITASHIKTIEGIGIRKTEKYGAPIVEMYNNATV